LNSFKVTINPFNKTVEIAENSSLYDAIHKSGIPIHADCGGEGKCGKCRVIVDKGDYRSEKNRLVTPEDSARNIVLACRTFPGSDITITIPDKTLLPYDYIEPLRSCPIAIKAETIDPLVKRFSLRLEEPSLDDNISDLERVKRGLKKAGVSGAIGCSLATMRKLAPLLRENGWMCDIYLLSADNSIVDAGRPSGGSRKLGIAIDIGTTTVATEFVDLESGRSIASHSLYNRQISCGADIIHRIVFSQKDDGLEKLRSLILATINETVKKITGESGRPREDIICAVLSGNTTMEHLLLAIDPKYIREEPYIPAATRFPILTAQAVGLDIPPHSPVMLTPSVGSYVGGDITSGVTASGMNNSDQLTLFMDIGTNGEIVIGNSEWMIACACSAGPAFEGGGIGDGMTATSGAIESVKIFDMNRPPVLTVIGGGQPRGICGSAMIDLMSELYYCGLINQKGKFNPDISKMIRKIKNTLGYIVAPKERTEHGKDIVITEIDIANLIRAKGAIWAGVSTLLKKLEIPFGDLQRVLIAGGLGNSLDIERSVSIGLLPDVERDKFCYLGNASLSGARLALLSEKARRELDEIASKMTYVDLSTTPGYMDEFVAALFIPHTDASLFPSMSS